MSAPLVSSLADLERLAEKLFRAGAFGPDVRSADAAFAILLTGWELGLPPSVAARSIALVKGRVSLSAATTVALCLRHREVCEYFSLVDSSEKAATYTTQRKGSPKPTMLTYTIAQAQRAGLVRQGTWTAHPEAMLRARAAAALARDVYPDLVAGCYDPDEAAEIAGDVARTQPAPAQAPAQPAATVPAEEAPRSTPRSTPMVAFEGDLHDCQTLADVAACWHSHSRELHEAEATDAATGAVGDWLGEHGYALTASEQQQVLARAWDADALRLADELARLGGRMGVVEWWVKEARARAEKLRDAAPLKRVVARTWAVRADRDAVRPGPAFAEAVKAFESTGSVPAPAEQPTAIVTSKGVALTTPEMVAAHIRGIKVVAHLEAAARKHGAHPWARRPLTERATELLDVHPDDAGARVAAWAEEGPKAPEMPDELREFYARIPSIELPGEGVAVWLSHLEALTAVTVEARDAAWDALCAHVGEVGKMGLRGAKSWMRKALDEELARRAVRP